MASAPANKIFIASDGNHSTIEGEEVVGRCPGCTLALVQGYAPDPDDAKRGRDTARVVRVLGHPMPYCEYFRSTHPNEIVAAIEAGATAAQAEHDRMVAAGDPAAIKAEHFLVLIKETELEHVQRKFTTDETTSEAVVTQRCSCGRRKETRVSTRTAEPTRVAIVRTALLDFYAAHMLCEAVS